MCKQIYVVGYNPECLVMCHLDYNSPRISAVYITPHPQNNLNFRYFIINQILFYYSTINFNQKFIRLLALCSDSDTFKYNCILVSKKSPRRWADCCPKHAGEEITTKVHQ